MIQRGAGLPQTRRGNSHETKYLDKALLLLKKFITKELPRHRINIQRDNRPYKITTTSIKKYLIKYLLGNNVSGALFTLMTRIEHGLDRPGLEIISRRKGVIEVRRIVGDGDE